VPGSYRLGLLALAAVVLLVPAGVASSFVLNILIQACIWGMLAASWDLLSGYAGQISFGQAGFFAVGAYTAALGSLHLWDSAWLGVLAGSLAAAVMGALIGIPALRLRGHYLAITTLGFSEILRLLVTNSVDLTNGIFGLSGFAGFSLLPAEALAQRRGQYLLALGLTAVACTSMYLICERSPLGKAFKAVREDEVLAMALGINVTRCTIAAFVISAFFAGFAGAFYAYYTLSVTPHTASVAVTVLVIGMAVLGGTGTILGPVLGAFLLTAATEALRFVGVIYNVIAVGLLLILLMLFLPGGLMSLVTRRQTLRGTRDRSTPHANGPKPTNHPLTGVDT
jgi:branched-chain amino acid transport system permease protein